MQPKCFCSQGDGDDGGSGMSDLLTDDEEAFFSKFPERIQV
jgi:hypothetical protein